MIAVAGVLLCAGLFFGLARRRIGALALLPTVVLLFPGTSWDVIVSPVGIPFLYAVAGGLGALLAVERRDRRGDVAACALITLAAASHTFGLVCLVGVAASVLLDRNRLRRLWVFVLPLALYALWWVLSSSTGTGDPRSTLAQASNVVPLPLYGLLSVGAAIASILGLNLAIDPPVPAGFNRTAAELDARPGAGAGRSGAPRRAAAPRRGRSRPVGLPGHARRVRAGDRPLDGPRAPADGRPLGLPRCGDRPARGRRGRPRPALLASGGGGGRR